MEKRHVLFENQFTSKIAHGVDTLSNAVKTTMGPKGKLVMVQQQQQS
jgi:chaperonin GroEL (HSP60 family)